MSGDYLNWEEYEEKILEIDYSAFKKSCRKRKMEKGKGIFLFRNIFK